jgi:hypothetical protein
MKIMIATRTAPLVLLRCVFASLPFACLPMTVVRAAESEAQTPATVPADATPVPRRSHIQPVGEIAMASRNPDTLGLRLTRATEVLRQQLSLARGAGLVVEDVIPDSVAEKSGFKQHDVLVLLDDQMLLLPEQLAALLEAFNVMHNVEGRLVLLNSQLIFWLNATLLAALENAVSYAAPTVTGLAGCAMSATAKPCSVRERRVAAAAPGGGT